MTGFFSEMIHSYRDGMERHRNRPFLRAVMAGCALVAVAEGAVTLRQRVRVDQVLETLDSLKVFDPHEGVELFNQFVEALQTSPEQGHEEAFSAIDAEVAQEPEKAELLVRICLAVSETEQGVPGREMEEVAHLCERLGVNAKVCQQK